VAAEHGVDRGAETDQPPANGLAFDLERGGEIVIQRAELGDGGAFREHGPHIGGVSDIATKAGAE
jgi:hypothetical protein